MSDFMPLIKDFSESLGGQLVYSGAAVAIFLIFVGLLSKNRRMTTKELSYSAMLIALATALSFVAIPLPQGGSVTPCSMFFIILIGCWFGPSVGLSSAISYGLLQFAIKPYFYHPVQVLLDYIIGFGVLGLGSFFFKKSRADDSASLVKRMFFNEYTLAVIIPLLLRLASSTISGVVFFSEYAGEMNPVVYSLLYNSSYIVTEMVLTLLLLAVPMFRAALSQVMKRTELVEKAEQGTEGSQENDIQ